MHCDGYLLLYSFRFNTKQAKPNEGQVCSCSSAGRVSTSPYKSFGPWQWWCFIPSLFIALSPFLLEHFDSLHCGRVSGLLVCYPAHPSTDIDMTVAVQRIWGKQWLESDRMVIFDSKKCNCIIFLAVLQSFFKKNLILTKQRCNFLMFLVPIIYFLLTVAEVWVYKSLFSSSSSDLLFKKCSFPPILYKILNNLITSCFYLN